MTTLSRVYKTHRYEELSNGDLLHLHPTIVNPIALPGRRLVQSPFFFLCIGIFTLVDRPILPLLERSARMTPRSVLLPGVSGFVQRMQDGKRADLGQPIGSCTQSTL